MVIKAKKSCDLLSASCRTGKASGAIQFKPDEPGARSTGEQKIDVPAQRGKRSRIHPSSAFFVVFWLSAD